LDIFANQLKQDLQVVNSASDDAKASISLAAKWAPTENSKMDTSKCVGKIAKRLFPDSRTSKKDYRKVYLTPLRSHLKVTEIFMCAGQWRQIEYSKVPSRCMNLSRKAFTKHDADGFAKFIEDAKAGKVEIKGKQMFPHELAKHYFSNSEVDEIVELQWKTIVDGVRKAGTLEDSIVLSDVSGSMSGTPMEVSVALGLLISEVTSAPFTNAVVTFHEKPKFHLVQGKTLCERVKNIMAMEWGGTTNFQAVFDLILARAKENKLAPQSMPKRIFVISDMQFNAAGGDNYSTNHEVIERKYQSAGYAVPQIIYWNVRANTNDFPVSSDKSGVALVSGFSPSILKNIVDAGTLPDPFTMMKSVIDGERYNLLTL